MLEPKEIDVYFNADAAKKNRAGKVISKRTRWVMLMKLALPCIAAILAITLLVLPSLKKDIKEFGIEFSIGEGDIEKLNVENTVVYVTDNKNRVNNFVAKQINEIEAGSQQYDLIAPEAVIPMPQNEWINIKAPNGLFNQTTSVLQLRNYVEIFYSRGMNIQTKEAFFDFKKSEGYSDTPVTGNGFIGKIDAQGFHFSNADNILTFTGKTHILINEENLQKE